MILTHIEAEYLPQEAGIEGIYKQIELCGRTSYLSWDKMTDDSAKKFVDMLIKSKHTSVLEHGTVYLKVPVTDETSYRIDCYHDNSYSKTRIKERKNKSFVFDYYITSNLRVLEEHGWLDDLQYLCEPTEFHEKRLTVKLTTSIDITRESNRNRVLSPTEESTRFCNYSKGKYNSSISVTVPSWVDESEIPTYKRLEWFADDIANGRTDRWDDLDWWLFANLACEKSYMMLLDKGWTPQQARKVLPLGTKSEIVYTAFESDWRHFFDLRLFGKTGEPHPQMKQLVELIKQEFEKAGVWEGIMKYSSKYE